MGSHPSLLDFIVAYLYGESPIFRPDFSLPPFIYIAVMSVATESSTAMLPKIKPISCPEDFYPWEQEARAYLSRIGALWTVELPLRPPPDAASILAQNEAYGLTGAAARATVSEIRTARKEYEKHIAEAHSFLLLAVDPAHRSTIVTALTPLARWNAIEARFKKREPATVMDALFGLLELKPSHEDTEAFIDKVKTVQNQLLTMDANPLVTVDTLCQGILLHKLAELHPSFVLDLKAKWTLENTDVTQTGLSIFQYSEQISKQKGKTSATAMTAELPVGRPSAKRQRSHTQQSGAHSTPRLRYNGPFCKYSKCVEEGNNRHDPTKCFYQHPELATEVWLSKHPDVTKPSTS